MADTALQPCISVIIPVRNGERYLGAAIESVLAQHYRPLEVLVVNDGSTDNTAAVVQHYAAQSVVCITQPPGGAASARNAGVELT